MALIKILYGSETGNAQDFAEQIWQKMYSNNIQAQCLAMDDYSINLLPTERTLIFIVSTSGDGDVPTNMRKSWTSLLSRKLAEKEYLSKTKFALLGLGDSSYTKYNFAGKKLFRRLIQLGAKPFMDLALADEQDRLGIDEVFEKWSGELFENEEFSAQSTAISTSLPRFYFDILPIDSNCKTDYYPLVVVKNERVTSEEHFQETRLISFCIEEELKENFRFLFFYWDFSYFPRFGILSYFSLFGILSYFSFYLHFIPRLLQFFLFLLFSIIFISSYSPGDVLMVLPENLSNSIQIAKTVLTKCEHLWNLPILISRSSTFVPVSPQFKRLCSFHNSTLTSLFQFYFDLQCIPKRSFIKNMAKKAENELEKERLQELCSPEGIDDYFEYCIYSKRSIAEFLRDFPMTSSLLYINDFLEFFPIIRPRAFSIASSPTAHLNEIQILVARVEYNIRRIKTPRFGLCSNFLSSIKPGHQVYSRINPGIFKFNKESITPHILIGPGTGIAPFRSIIAENELNSNCPITLFFGCRSEKMDFYFKDEWKKYSNLNLITAFSRDQENKIYVQNRINERAEEMWNLINNGAKIFIAGSAGDMPKQVISTFKQIIIKEGNKSLEEVDKFVEMLEKKKLIQYETWKMDDFFSLLFKIVLDIVCAILLSISFGLVHVNPTKFVRPFLHLFTRKSTEEKALDFINNKIMQTKGQMSELSPTADFAKYYKCERSLNKLKEEKDKLAKTILSNSIKSSVKIEIASRIIFMVISSIIMWNTQFFVLTKIDRRWFYPLNNIFDFFEERQGHNITLFSFVLLTIIVKKIWDYRNNNTKNIASKLE